MKYSKYLAIDIGASHGRAILGILRNGRLTFEEIHNFPNTPIVEEERIHWDVRSLFCEILKGLQKCTEAGHASINSMAIDTWGIDFGILNDQGILIGKPHHYRDPRTDGVKDKFFKVIPEIDLYMLTGIQTIKFNTLFQLYSMKLDNSSDLQEAGTLLFMPDLLNYLLTGKKFTEFSIAGTSQLLDLESRMWSTEMLAMLGIPCEFFPEIRPSCSVVGMLRDEFSGGGMMKSIPVIAVTEHDTQAAIASIPSTNGKYAYISCGTWSIMGVETDKTICTEDSCKSGFSNEIGLSDKVCLLKTIPGLWLIQECRAQWEREGERINYQQMELVVLAAEQFKSFIDPEDEMFILPGDMPERIREYCRKTGQFVPGSIGEIVCCILQSLAMKYRTTLNDLERICGYEIPVVHIVGGGVKDRTLCRFSANAMGRRVIAGPVEATAIGNVIQQAIALGDIEDIQEGRKIIKQSCRIIDYEPVDAEVWQEAYQNYSTIIGRDKNNDGNE
ncbi:MAG: rhamnulokinase family protein [Eubacteriales bacterium]